LEEAKANLAHVQDYFQYQSVHASPGILTRACTPNKTLKGLNALQK